MLKKLFYSSGLRQSLILTSGNFLSVLLSAIGLILISRQLGPTSFGEFTVGYSLMIIIVRLQGLGLNVAIQKIAGLYFQDKAWSTKLNQLLQVGTGINLVLFGVSLLAALLLSWPLSKLLHIEATELIFGSFLFASITLAFEYLTSILQVVHRFTESVYMMLVQSLLKLLVGVSALYLGIKEVSMLYYAFYLVPIFGIGLGLKALPKELKILPPQRHPEIEAQLWKVMKHSAVLMATAGLIDYLDVLLVKHYTTAYEAGIYGGISQLASAVMVVGYSLAAVLNARVARYHSMIHLHSYLKKAVMVPVLALAAFFCYLPLSKLSILLTIGPEYIAGLPYLQILMIGSFLLIATVPFIALFYSFDSHTYFSVSGLGQLLIVALGGQYLISHFGLTGAVWTKVLSRVFLFGLTLVWAILAYRRKAKVQPV